MKVAKIILPLFALGILVCSNSYVKVSQPSNAWRAYKNDLNADELETTFISEEQDTKGFYHYKYHVKNISEFYISRFNACGNYTIYTVDGEEYIDGQLATAIVEDDYFNRQTLVIGPNQETDVDFCVMNKYTNVNEVEITAAGYSTDKSADVVTGVGLENNVLNLHDGIVHLNIDDKDGKYYYYAFLKTNIDDKEYFFVASDETNFKVAGNYTEKCDEDINIELVKVIKMLHYSPEEIERVEKGINEETVKGIFMELREPIIVCCVSIFIGLVVVCVITVISHKKHKKNNNQ